MEIISLEEYLRSIDAKINKTQAEIDDLELFGGSRDQENQLRVQLTELQDKKARIVRAFEQARQRNKIVLENGDTIIIWFSGGWGRLHYVSRALGPNKRERDFWICSECQKEITKGQEHYRRNYYTDKSDNRSGNQIRLCLNCYADHAEQHPCNTTFPVYRSAQRKAA